jgi:hypothetical protein
MSSVLFLVDVTSSLDAFLLRDTKGIQSFCEHLKRLPNNFLGTAKESQLPIVLKVLNVVKKAQVKESKKNFH